MIPLTALTANTFAVLGLGRSGRTAAQALLTADKSVLAWDDNAGARETAAADGLPIVDLQARGLAGVDALVLSPGIPHSFPAPHPVATLARAQGVPIIGDIELLFAAQPDARYIGITGTNGKSTTTALIDHLLRSAGRDSQMGGNIGRAVLSLEPFAPERTYVVECSSFQIDLAPSCDPTVGILTNLSEDHIDRHGTMEAYAAIKERMVEAAQTAVVGVDDAMSAAIADLLEGEGHEVVRVSAAHRLQDGIFAEGSKIFAATAGETREIADLVGIGSLRGRHNAQNACGAIAAVRALGLGEDEIRAGLATFPGLAHRMEQVGHLGRVLFVNDSKATNADSTAQALASFERVYWIAGGKPKSGGITTLGDFFPKVAKAYLIGAAAAEFAATLEGRVPYVIAETIERAVELARADAASDSVSEPVVLLSPACASYDQFKNFEVRGDHFRDVVKALPGLEPIGGGRA